MADAVLLHARPGVGAWRRAGRSRFRAFRRGWRLRRASSSASSMAQPVTSFAQPSIHQPSSMLRLGDAVEGGLHAGGAGGLIGAARRVDPDVDALGQQRAQFPVVVFEVEDADAAGLELGGCFEDVADEALAGVVGGMGFAGVEDLQAADLLGQSREALGIVRRAGWRACRWRRGGQSRG